MPETPSNAEFSLIARYFSGLDGAQHVPVGVGDDAAILTLPPGEQLVTSVDTSIEGVHFFRGAEAADVAYRAVAAAASDLAAMGAQPLGMTLALTLPSPSEHWLTAFRQGLSAASREFQLPLVGGDTCAGSLAICVQVMGSVPAGQALLRSGARVGDHLYVSGTLGDSAAALAALRGQWQPSSEIEGYLRGRFFRPPSCLALGQELRGHASAAIDVSDGLLADAAHIANLSGVAIEVDVDLLPLSLAVQSQSCQETRQRWALAGGDDYELLFTLHPSTAVPVGTTRIGEVTVGSGVHCSVAIDFPLGYQHFGPQHDAV